MTMLSTVLWVPPDNDEQRIKHERMPNRRGTCGPSCIAVLEHTTVQSILDHWAPTWRGFAPIAEVKDVLSAYGYVYTYVRAHKAKTFPTPTTDIAIMRIQWLKEDGTEYYWRAAGSHTHYVLMRKVNGVWFVFSNSEGWFEKDEMFGRKYLEGRGYVSSYLEIGATKNG